MSIYKDFIEKFRQKRDMHGSTHSIVFQNWAQANNALYRLALMEAGVENCYDDEVFPAVFGDNFEAVISKCKNAYFGFNFCIEFLNKRSIGKTKDEAIAAVINEERITWERSSGIDFDALIERRLNEKQLVYYTALGLILFNTDTNDFEPNPLFLSDEQYDRWANPKL